MTHQIIHLNVADFDAWRSVHTSMEDVQKAHGLVSHHISRGVDDPDEVTLILEWEDAERMGQYFEPDAVKDAMGRAGILSSPDVTVLGG